LGQQWPGERVAGRAAWRSRFGAQEAVLEDLGHWWMMQDPVLGAKTLTDFLASLDS
jgi:hypothetical protein